MALSRYTLNFPRTLPKNNVRWLTSTLTLQSDETVKDPPSDNTYPIPEEQQFRKLDLGKRIVQRRTLRTQLNIKMLPPRYTKMPVDQDWSSVWPAARSFNPSVVPLPIHQGYVQKGVPPTKFANLELMKIPNFLHLTPPAIKKHCAAIKKFCTPWPEGLETDEMCEKNFPVEITTNDYCHSGPSIRDPKARIVTLEVRLGLLDLDDHARDKLLRLLGERYDFETDTMTIVVERCPMRKQNYDYAQYLLAALYYESCKTEPWESEKAEPDYEKYVWVNSQSNKTVFDMVRFAKTVENVEEPGQILPWVADVPEDSQASDVINVKSVEPYAEAITKLHNEGENEDSLNEYKDSVQKLLGLQMYKA